MPLYEYRCSSCGERVEVLQRVGDPPLAVCGACGGAMEKLLAAPALQFRGSGWYITDYARKGNGNGASREGQPAAQGDKPAATTGQKEPGKDVPAPASTAASAGTA